jgi:hypothetical protein
MWAETTRRDSESRIAKVEADPIASMNVARLGVADFERWHARTRKTGVGEDAIKGPPRRVAGAQWVDRDGAQLPVDGSACVIRRDGESYVDDVTTETPNTCTVTLDSQTVDEIVALRTVVGRLGHVNPAMTLRVYAHAREGADQVVAATLASALDHPEAE